MRYILTLTKVTRNDSETLGYRAADLAVLKEKGLNIPLTFVVNNEALEDFMAENGLKNKIERVFQEKPDPKAAFQDILNLFIKSKFSKELLSELNDAYDSLAVELGTTAHGIISEFDSQFVTLVRSPSYLLPTDDEEGIIQNIRGIESVYAALKILWATAYSPDSMNYREKSRISSAFSTGVIVQKMRKANNSAIAYSRTEFNEFMIRVKCFKGYQDYADPIIGKDIFEIDSNSLLIRNSQVNSQEHELTRDLNSEELVKRPLLDQGSAQKLNDKTVSEIARLTKRCKSFIGKDVKLYLTLHENNFNVLQVNRMLYSPKKSEAETLLEIAQTQDNPGVESANPGTESAGDKLRSKIPGLLSMEEAKEKIQSNSQHKLFSMEGFEEQKENKIINKIINGPAQENDLEKNTAPNTVPEQTQQPNQETMLSKVRLLNKFLDEMQDAALENNQEAFFEAEKHLSVLLK